MKNDILHKAKKGYQQEIEQIPLNHNLLKEITQNDSKKSGFIPLWLTKPIPAYSLVLMGFLFLLSFLFLKQDNSSPPIISAPLTAYIHDTVFIKDSIFQLSETPIQLVSTTKKIKQKNKKTTKSTITKGLVKKKIKDELPEQENYFDPKLLENQQSIVGTSAEESQELAQFLGVQI